VTSPHHPTGTDDGDVWSPVWDQPVVVTGVSSHLAHVRWSLLTVSVLAVPAAVVGGLVTGGAGVAAALAACATVALFFAVSAVAVAWADRRDPRLTLPVALSTYLVKVVVAGVVAFRVVNGDARWHGVYAACLGVALVGWLGAHATWFVRTPPPQVRPADPDATEMNAG
jgi:hypothetical protein